MLFTLALVALAVLVAICLPSIIGIALTIALVGLAGLAVVWLFGLFAPGWLFLLVCLLALVWISRSRAQT